MIKKSKICTAEIIISEQWLWKVAWFLKEDYCPARNHTALHDHVVSKMISTVVWLSCFCMKSRKKVNKWFWNQNFWNWVTKSNKSFKIVLLFKNQIQPKKMNWYPLQNFVQFSYMTCWKTLFSFIKKSGTI